MRKNKNYYIKRSCFFLILVLTSAMLANSAWILKIVRKLFLPSLNYHLCVLWIRIAWAFTVIQFHSLALFIESLIEKEKLFGTRQRVLLIISGTFFSVLMTLSFLSFFFPNAHRSIESQLIATILQYCTFPVLSLSLLVTFFKLNHAKLPRLLLRQASLFIKTMIFPFLLLEATQIYPLSKIKTLLGGGYAFASASTLMLAYAIFYCARKIIGLRFLNLKNHVERQGGFDFINDFRHVLERFSSVTNVQELRHIARTFFQQAFSIPKYKTHLYIRQPVAQPGSFEQRQKLSTHEHTVERFLSAYQSKELLTSNNIFFTDNVDFNRFYDQNEKHQVTLYFLNELNADLFIPIVHGKKLVGYIIVDRYARISDTKRWKEFYGEVERDYMLVFVEYLRNIIHLLHDKNFNNLLQQEKKLEQEVYLKHQEINQYKESIQSFSQLSRQAMGIIFYKHRRFTLGNRSAHELINVDLNTKSGHPTTKKLKTLAQQVLEYKTTQTCLIDSPKNEKLVVSGIPNLEQNNVIITVHFPEISDLLKKKIELLKNPSDWGFLLCLETTKSGKQINSLLPGSGETLLNFKINLLKAALGKQALLIDLPEQDTKSVVEVIHNISLKEKLHIINLQGPTNQDVSAKLFGMNTILGFKATETPLLEKLENGTLFIQNIHFLNLEAQEHLAEFIRYGMYRRLKSDQRIRGNVRIICSTTKNPRNALQEGILSKSLFDELHKNFLSMPSLINFSEEELEELIHSFSKQFIRQEIFENLLGLSEREKRKIINSHPLSFHELRMKVKQQLVEKSKQRAIGEETDLFEPAYTTTDPDLIEASQLGKQALKDPRIMEMLWKKFQNQNKIAIFLGVNRSSVNRRCKEYGLI